MAKLIVASTRIPPELSADIDRLAGALDRSRAWIIKQAIERYVGEELEFIEFLQEGEDAIQRGEYYTQEEMEEWVAKRIGKKPDLDVPDAA